MTVVAAEEAIGTGGDTQLTTWLRSTRSWP